MSKTAPDQHPAVPESDVSARGAVPLLGARSEVWLTDAEDSLLAEWWVSEGGGHEDLALDSLNTAVEKIVAERLRVVEGERDAARASIKAWADDVAGWKTDALAMKARAESAEAALKALVAGIEALADESMDRRQPGYVSALALRALLPGDGQ